MTAPSPRARPWRSCQAPNPKPRVTSSAARTPPEDERGSFAFLPSFEREKETRASLPFNLRLQQLLGGQERARLQTFISSSPSVRACSAPRRIRQTTCWALGSGAVRIQLRAVSRTSSGLKFSPRWQRLLTLPNPNQRLRTPKAPRGSSGPLARTRSGPASHQPRVLAEPSGSAQEGHGNDKCNDAARCSRSLFHQHVEAHDGQDAPKHKFLTL